MLTSITISLVLASLVVIGALLFVIFGMQGPSQSSSKSSDGSEASASEEGEESVEADARAWDGTWIDTHAHLSSNVVAGGTSDVCRSEACLEEMIRVMETYGISMTMLMNPPAPSAVAEKNEKEIQAAVATRPDLLGYLGGGGALNHFLQEAETELVTEEIRAEFETLARDLVRSGAHGFGEMTALHLSLSEAHAFEQVSPDNELFLLLADLAAEYDLPIDLHMDPVLEPMATPSEYTSSRNPATIQENMMAFERLLAHNQDAKIVWAHVGRNNLGNETPELYRRLLTTYDNLYLQLHVIPRPGNSILDVGRKILPEWLALMEEFPDRFVMGTDSFYGSSQVHQNLLSLQVKFLEQLPASVANAVATENAMKIYKLE